MKSADVKDNTYIDFKKDSNDKDPKLKVGGHVRISKYKNIFAKDIYQIGQKIYLLLRKLKIPYHGHMFLMILMVKKLLALFMKMNYKTLSKMNLELKK